MRDREITRKGIPMHEVSELLRVAVPIASVGALAATITITRVRGAHSRRVDHASLSEAARTLQDLDHLVPAPVNVAPAREKAR